jgi:predicted RNA binding protein YcfA (HicA-like mRNA interferase family)
MSRKLPVISGEKMVKIPAKQGFEIRRQTSSHVVVQKEWRVFSVPLHKEIKKGTLIAILKQADITLRNLNNFSTDLITPRIT